MSDWLGDAIRAAEAARSDFEAAESAWLDAGRDHRVAWHRNARPILDEYDCETGEYEPLSKEQLDELDALAAAEEAAHARRQAAHERWQRAERILAGSGF
jgi:hypothetical protein